MDTASPDLVFIVSQISYTLTFLINVIRFLAIFAATLIIGPVILLVSCDLIVYGFRVIKISKVAKFIIKGVLDLKLPSDNEEGEHITERQDTFIDTASKKNERYGDHDTSTDDIHVSYDRKTVTFSEHFRESDQVIYETVSY